MPSSRISLILIASVILTGLFISLRISFNDKQYVVNVKKKTTIARITFNNDTTKSISTKLTFPDIMNKWDILNGSKDEGKEVERYYLSQNYTNGRFDAKMKSGLVDESDMKKVVPIKAFDRSLEKGENLWPTNEGWHQIGSNHQNFDVSSVSEKSNETVLNRRKRAPPCERGEDLDDYVDNLFRFAQTVIRIMEPFSAIVPNITIDLPEYNLIVFLHSGGATNVNKLERKKPAWIHCSNDSTSLGMTIKFQEIRLMYKMRVIKDWKLLFDGSLNVQIVRPKVQVQFTQSMPPEGSEEVVQQRVDALRIWSVDKIRIMIKGLGNLTQAVSMFLTGYVNRNLHTLLMDPRIYDLELLLMRGANDYLKNTTIDFFNLVD